jgi:hypothetical protein
MGDQWRGEGRRFIYLHSIFKGNYIPMSFRRPVETKIKNLAAGSRRGEDLRHF